MAACRQCLREPGKPTYCSATCVGLAKRRRVTWTCIRDGCTVSRTTTPSKERRYCSKSCAAMALGSSLDPHIREARRRGAQKTHAKNRDAYRGRLKQKLAGVTSLYEAWKLGFSQGYREGYTRSEEKHRQRAVLRAMSVQRTGAA
jgi:hypothetical protein